MPIGELDNPNQSLQTLDTVIDELFETPTACLTKEEAGHRIVQLQHVRVRLDALVVESTLAAQAAAVSTLTHGVRTTAQYVADKTGHSPKTVRSDQLLGSWLRTFPDFANAYAAGILTRIHLNKLRCADKAKVHFLLQRDQQLHIDNAANLDYPGFCHALTYWLNAADPDGDLPKEQIANTGASYKQNADGSIDVKAHLHPVAAEGFKRAFDHEKQQVFDSDSEAGTKRSDYQRGGDALINLISRGFARQDGSYPIPMFDFVVSYEVAEAIVANLLKPDSHVNVPIDHDDIDGRCETIDGTPIHPYLIGKLIGIGRFRRHIFKPDGHKIAETNVKSSRFPSWMGNIMRIETRGQCSTPGCDAPFSWLHNDHIQPRSKGGQTNTQNGTTLCGPDNRWKRDDPDRAA